MTSYHFGISVDPCNININNHKQIYKPQRLFPQKKTPNSTKDQIELLDDRQKQCSLDALPPPDNAGPSYNPSAVDTSQAEPEASLQNSQQEAIP